MHFACSAPSLLTLFLLLFAVTTTAATTSRVSNSLHLSSWAYDTGDLRPKVKAISPNHLLQTRGRGFQELGNGVTLRYKTFAPFDPSWSVALSLSYFWAQILQKVLDPVQTPDSDLLRNFISLRMPVAEGALGGGAELIFEVISFEEYPIPRDIVSFIAEGMLEYSIRGFCVLFNARLRRAPGAAPIFATLRLRMPGDGPGS